MNPLTSNLAALLPPDPNLCPTAPGRRCVPSWSGHLPRSGRYRCAYCGRPAEPPPYTTIDLAAISRAYPYPVADLGANPYRDAPCYCGCRTARDTAQYGEATRRCDGCAATRLVAKGPPPYTHRCDGCGRGFHGPVPLCPSFDCPGTVRALTEPYQENVSGSESTSSPA